MEVYLKFPPIKNNTIFFGKIKVRALQIGLERKAQEGRIKSALHMRDLAMQKQRVDAGYAPYTSGSTAEDSKVQEKKRKNLNLFKATL